MTWAVLADTLRMGNVAMALALVALVGACAVFAATWDQRARFITLGGYGVVTVGGQIDAMGRPLSWPLVLLAAVTVSAVIGTAYYLIRVRRARSAGDQLVVPRTREPARRGRHTGRGPLPQRRGDQA